LPDSPDAYTSESVEPGSRVIIDMDFLAVVTALEEQEDLFAELHPRYKALMEVC